MDKANNISRRPTRARISRPDASHEVTAAPASVPTTTRARLGQAADPASAARGHSRVAGHTVTQADPAPVAMAVATPVTLNPAQQRALNDQLSTAAANGMVEEAQRLIEAGADIDAKDKQQATPLHWAVINRHEEVVYLLLDKGADFNAKDREQRTPLHWAVIYDHKAIIPLLLHAGADFNAEDSERWTPLYLAAFHGRENAARLLIKHGADVNPKMENQYLPLYRAIENKHDNIARLLIEHGADINPKMKDRIPLLHQAATNGQEDIVRLLLDRGIDVNAKDERDQQTPLHYAAQNNREVLSMLLLDKGADINAKDHHQWTPLYGATLQGHKAIVRLLLDRGADVHSIVPNGFCKCSTAVQIAIQGGRLDLVQCFLEQRSGQIDITVVELRTLCISVLWKALLPSYLANEDAWHMVLMVAWETFFKPHITEELTELNEQTRAELIRTLRGLFAQALETEVFQPLRAMQGNPKAAALADELVWISQQDNVIRINKI